MACRFRALSRPVSTFFKSRSFIKPSSSPSPSTCLPRLPSPSFPRVRREMVMLESLMPLHSAVSSARLTSRLGIDSLRSLSQGTICASNPGV